MIRILITLWLCLASPLLWGQASPPGVQGRSAFVLSERLDFYSPQLQENRFVNVYLPEGYAAADTVRYPVIYLLDGGVDEDFIHIVGLVQYYSFEWIEVLPKSIVVGIGNVARRRDFTFPTRVEQDSKRYPEAGHSARFIEFLEKELQPLVQKEFRALDRGTLIGQSLGGLLAAEVLLRRPALFNRYIIVSPSLWWDGGSILSENWTTLKNNLPLRTDVYVGVGNEGPTPSDPPRIMEEDAKKLAELLKSVNNPALNCVFDYLPEENHATILHQAVMNAFKHLHKIGKK